MNLTLNKIQQQIIIKLTTAIFFGVLAFVESRTFFFESNPFLQTPYFAETVIGLFVAAIAYFFFPAIGKLISEWLELLIRNTVYKLLKQFFHEREEARKKAGKLEELSIKTSPLILDTSAIIDGRILHLAKSGFFAGKVVVPEYVISELQQVADSANEIKRKRGRYGLEVLNNLRKILKDRFFVFPTKEKGDVDKLLVSFARKSHGSIVTVDFNLNRVARLSGITILNVNDLANALKTNAIPGESFSLKIVHQGKDSSQGVGYLEDGTMVVVEGAGDKLGSSIKTSVSRVLQTEAGRMIFAKIQNGD